MSEQLACPVCPSSCDEHDQEQRAHLWATLHPGDEPRMEEAPPDASDPGTVEKGKRVEKRRQLARRKELEWLVQQRPFRSYLAVLVARHRVFEPTTVPGDTHATALAMGERNVALRCLSEIRELDRVAAASILAEGMNLDVAA